MYTASNTYGAMVQPQIPGASAGFSTPTANMSMDLGDVGGYRELINPRNPLFVFGVLLAATLGAIGVSGSARVGPAKLAADLGKT